MEKALDITVREADDMREFGATLGALLSGGDVVVLDGPLGAGKTTFTQGVAEGMKVGGRVTSPTFAIARVHASLVGGPDLVHVDAYRIESLEEVDALDLDASLDTSATVIEWGSGKVEGISSDRLTVRIVRPEGGDGSVDELCEDSPRRMRLAASGPRSRSIVESLRATLG